LHFAFFLKNFKSSKNKDTLQEIYDYIFRQLELSIREIGYGDQSINKKMKDYLNVFYGMIDKIDTWNKLFAFLGVNRPGEKLHKLSEAMLDAGSSYQFYLNTISQWKNPENIIKHPLSKKNSFNGASIPDGSFLTNDPEKMMFFDSMSYLPDDILTKVDRASMAVSLEARTPFLDKEIVKFALTLPLEYKIKAGVGKSILRDVLYKYVPRDMIERPKMGFGVPLAEWMRGELRVWCEGLLNEKKLKEDGFFNSNVICEKWNEHLNGDVDWHHELWNVLIFQAWLENNR
jgi:asparagine synthase (glutamine-hydrolysing)